MFKPGELGPLRGFEVQLGIGSRRGLDAWSSRFPSVQKLLNHLSRYTQSESSREKYLRNLTQFCRWSGLGPDELVRLPRQKAESLVQEFADRLAKNDASRAYVNGMIKRLRLFFRVNGFEGYKELHLQTYFLPARYRKVAEYIPTKGEVYSIADAADGLRDRAVILALWSSGLRVSTLCALNYGDVAPELERGEPYVMIPIYPAMKGRVPDACKGRISYYTFLSPETSEAIRSYIRDREERYGQVNADDPLFNSEWSLWDRGVRSGKRLGRRAVGKIVKRAAKLAGLKEWKHVTPHCLRKAFESVLVSQTVDGGRMDKATQEFLMGHILPGTQDPYYDRTKVEHHRSEYAKLDFSRNRASSKVVDRLIEMAELERHLNEGWLFVAKVTDHKAIVRRSG